MAITEFEMNSVIFLLITWNAFYVKWECAMYFVVSCLQNKFFSYLIVLLLFRIIFLSLRLNYGVAIAGGDG